MSLRIFLSVVLLAGCLPCVGQQKAHLDIESPFGSFVEEEFPFLSQTLDARAFGETPESTNLTPRGIIVKLGNDHYGCFDPDLLRWSLIWRANGEGEYLTMDGMGPGSYRLPNRKAPSGQESLPRPIGTLLWQSPALPGWSIGDEPTDKDPRERGESDEGEIGLGPIPSEIGRFSGIRLVKGGIVIEYIVGLSTIRETLAASSGELKRTLSIEPSTQVLHFRDWEGWSKVAPTSGNHHLETVIQLEGAVSIVSIDDTQKADLVWKDSVTTTFSSPAEDTPQAFVFDDLPLPVPNPWKRNVRLAGIDFFPDGRAALCTFDGDIWLVDGLEENSTEAEWSRFASGLHEPKTVCIVNGEIFVSDRNGIVRIVDTDRNGEADWYENFSNIVPQTAETREFAMDMVATEDGGFFLAKGGQVGSTRGIANGTIVKVSPDGRSYDIIATGLRQPYIGYDPETGILTSSDQQGHWKPATPIYRIEKGNYYGFQPAKLKEKAFHPAKIAPPEIWIPHFINQSGASQVWMKNGAKMGPLNGALVHIGYNRPEIFRVLLDEDRSQGAVVPILSGFPAGVLKGRIHPGDGRLYLTGFEIWGTSGERVSGLFRVRPGHGESWLPNRVTAGKRGVLLSFDQTLSAELAADTSRYSVDRWNYQQTHNYGSGNFKLDGKPGQESIDVSSAKLSKDRKSIFIGLPNMQPSHSLRLTYRLPFAESTRVDSAYLTVHSLKKLDLLSLGFADGDVDLTPPKTITGTGKKIDPTAKLGKVVAMRYGCIACHATGESDVPAPPPTVAGAQVAVGPAWAGLWKSHRTFTDGSFIKSVDETYLRESILDPGRRVAEGYETEKTGVGMPSYLGVLKDHEIDSIILYIQTLRKKKV
ncbi:MAG: hypothetical protein P1U87_10530 [Verrucomicrobiales bacterium]|nr:hypothetical protein [Verrucomicrobiales bacterium]